MSETRADTAPAHGRNALAFIFITVLIDLIGLGVIIPVMPELITSLTGGTLADAARWGGAIMFTYAGIQFFSAPVIGNLSDRFGRRPILLLCLAGFAIDYLIMGFAQNLIWLFVGRALAGVFGATYSTAAAYIADVSSPEKKSQNFGLIGAAFGLGFTIGPVIGGFAGEIDPRLPFFIAAGLAGLNLVYGLIVLPESLPPEKRRPFVLKGANPLSTALRMSKYPGFVWLGGALLLLNVAHFSLSSTWSYYTMYRFEWTPANVGASLGAVGILSAIVQGGLIRKVIPLLGQQRSALIGCTIMMIALMGYAFAPNGAVIYTILVFGSLAGIAGPAVQGIISNQIPDNEQGALQGALTSLMSLSTLMAPPVMTQIFGYFARPDAPVYFPGAAFAFASALAFIGLMLMVRAFRSETVKTV